MKRVMVAFIVLLLAGITVSSGAFSIPSSLSGLGMPSYGTSSSGSSLPAGSFSTPSSDLQVSSPSSSAFSNWDLNNMQFFSPSNKASTGSLSSISPSDYSDIAQMLSQLPTSDQMSQYYGGGTGSTATATPTPDPTETFTTNVSSEIPADQVIFVEVSKNAVPMDPSGQGIIIPNVTMNYKFSDSQKQLVLKTKSGVDLNNTKIIFGYADSDDVNNRYVYDYGIGSCPGMDVPVLFMGADGRVRVTFQGQNRDLMPGQKVDIVNNQGGATVTLTITNWGLVPKANIKVSDTI